MMFEQALKFPVPVHVEHRNFDVLAIRKLVDKRMIPPNCDEYIKIIKHDMAHILADKLMDEGYICYYTREDQSDPIYEHGEIEARLEVAKPRNGGILYDQCP
jgi:hypothetical protein